jgi:hypothetical protein
MAGERNVAVAFADPRHDTAAAATKIVAIIAVARWVRPAPRAIYYFLVIGGSSIQLAQ